MKTQTLSLDAVKTKVHLLKKIHVAKSIPVPKVASELGVKPTVLMEFIEHHPQLFSVVGAVVRKKQVLSIIEVYTSLEEVPGSDEWRAKKIKENEKVLALSHYDNYGHISGHYLEPSKGEASHFLNTADKLVQITQRFTLAPAGYYLGGFGDCSFIQPKGGVVINKTQREELKKDGWILLNEVECKDEK